jgi:hypothetical protein
MKSKSKLKMVVKKKQTHPNVPSPSSLYPSSPPDTEPHTPSQASTPSNHARAVLHSAHNTPPDTLLATISEPAIPPSRPASRIPVAAPTALRPPKPRPNATPTALVLNNTGLVRHGKRGPVVPLDGAWGYSARVASAGGTRCRSLGAVRRRRRRRENRIGGARPWTSWEPSPGPRLWPWERPRRTLPKPIPRLVRRYIS